MAALTLRVGLKLSQQVHPVAVQREAWRAADEAGFDHIWLFDHLVPIHQDPTHAIFDGWTLLAAMAENTTHARIGLNVTGNLYRHPGLLAKIAVTVDHLSNGRLEMGLGAGWSESEFRMYGMPFPSAADRIRMLDEACGMLALLWSQSRASFDGSFYTLTEAIAEPKPLQRPRPPLWVGGNGPKRTLRVVAERADVWSCDVWPTNAAAMETAYDLAKILDAHCATVGRDPTTIRRAHALVVDDADTALAIARSSVRAGFTDFLLVPVRALGPGGDLRAGVEAAARLQRELRALS